MRGLSPPLSKVGGGGGGGARPPPPLPPISPPLHSQTLQDMYRFMYSHVALLLYCSNHGFHHNYFLVHSVVHIIIIIMTWYISTFFS